MEKYTHRSDKAQFHPIAALSSGKDGAIGLIRCSGQDAHRIVLKHLKLTNPQPRFQHLTNFVEADGVIDEVLVSFFPSPNSFSGEDMVEISCHGGPFIIGQILAALYRSGFKEAEPGEFTKRAFLHGKLDLTQAEGINELIGAQSHSQWQAARSLATGTLAEHINELRESLIQTMALVEARIDFPDEEETAAIARQQVLQRLSKLQSQITKLRESYTGGRIASEGFKVALVGAPNTGKSTLLNELLGEERAIVTDIAGTTRDYLEERCLISGRLFRLVDTAGIRSADNQVEKIGIERSMKLSASADLVLILLSSDSTEAEREKIVDSMANLPYQCVLTKADLGVPKWGADLLQTSTMTGTGLEELKSYLVASADRFTSGLHERPFITSERHLRCLQNSEQFLRSAINLLAESNNDELLGFELQEAARALQQVVGSVESENLFDEIFSRFCLGK